MTTTVAVTNGVGVQTGKLFAFDAVSTVNLTGLASAYNGLALTAYVTGRDGRIALAPLATCTAGTTTASFAFDFRTGPCRGLFSTGAETNQKVRLRVMVTATSQVVCDALLDMVPGAEAGTTTTSTGSAAASLAEAQALVDAHIADATAAHAASAVSVAATPDNYTAATADVEAHLAGIDDALASAIGDVVGPPGATDGRPALFDGVTGKLLKQHTAALGGAAILNVGTTAGTVAAGDDSRLSDSRTPTAHAASHKTGGTDALAAADIGAAAIETPAASENKSGAAVAPDFGAARTLTWTLTGNITSFALATNLPNQACAVHITLAGYTLPADPPSTALKGVWDVSGTYVDIIIEPRAGGGQSWRAESLEVAT
jgi:cell pole-organizing protein PopZ